MSGDKPKKPDDRVSEAPTPEPGVGPRQKPGERGGPRGPEPTRFGDWEKGGRCSDF